MVTLSHIIYAILFAVAVIFLWEAQTFPSPLSTSDIGAAMFPVWLVIILMILIIVDLFVSRGHAQKVPYSDIVLAVLFAIGMGGTVWGASQFGFFYVLPVAMFIALRLIGSRRYLANGIFSIVMPIVLWFLFDQTLNIPLSRM